MATESMGTIQAPGSMSLHEVPDRSAEAIVEAYRNLGGSEVSQFLLPDERISQGRVTQPGVIACIRAEKFDRLFDVPLSCFASPSAPVYLIAASTRATDDVLAAPELIRDGKVGILQLRSGSDLIESETLISATPDPALGGNLPGLVVPKGFGATDSIVLRGGGTRMLVLHDFGSLGPVDQSRMRATIARLASAAQVIDTSRGDAPSRRRSAVAAGSLAIAAVTFAIMLLAGAGAIVGSRRLAQGLDAVGAGPRYRRRLVARMLALPAVSLLGSLGAVAATNVAVNAAPGTSFGTTWPAPAGGALLALVILAPWWLRVTDRE